MRDHWRYYRDGQLVETRDNGAMMAWSDPLTEGRADVAVDFARRDYCIAGELPSGRPHYASVAFEEPGA